MKAGRAQGCVVSGTCWVLGRMESTKKQDHPKVPLNLQSCSGTRAWSWASLICTHSGVHWTEFTSLRLYSCHLHRKGVFTRAMHLEITVLNVSFHSALGCGISPTCRAKSCKAGGMFTQLISLLLLCKRHKFWEIQFPLISNRQWDYLALLGNNSFPSEKIEISAPKMCIHQAKAPVVAEEGLGWFSQQFLVSCLEAQTFLHGALEGVAQPVQSKMNTTKTGYSWNWLRQYLM